MPTLPFELKKPNRIASQLGKFKMDLLRGFRAGLWFEQRTMAGPNRPVMFSNFQANIRSLARYQLPQSQKDPENEGNVIRDIWSRRKPISHLAIAAVTSIALFHEERDLDGLDLEMTVFDPVWVKRAIEESESQARSALLMGAFTENQLYRFNRDSF